MLLRAFPRSTSALMRADTLAAAAHGGTTPARALIVGGGVVSGASSPNNTQLVLSTGNHAICKKPQNVA